MKTFRTENFFTLIDKIISTVLEFSVRSFHTLCCSLSASNQITGTGTTVELLSLMMEKWFQGERFEKILMIFSTGWKFPGPLRGLDQNFRRKSTSCTEDTSMPTLIHLLDF